MGALRVQRARAQLVHGVPYEGDGMTRLIDGETLMNIGTIMAIVAFALLLLGFLVFVIGFCMENL